MSKRTPCRAGASAAGRNAGEDGWPVYLSESDQRMVRGLVSEDDEEMVPLETILQKRTEADGVTRPRHAALLVKKETE